MGGQHGVVESGKVVSALAEVGNVLEKVIGTEGNALSKASHLLMLADELVILSTLNASELKLEFKELDDADKASLLSSFKAKFDLADDKLEGLVEEGMGLGKEGAEFVKKIISFAQKVKGQ